MEPDRKVLTFWVNKDIRRRAYDMSIIQLERPDGDPIDVIQPFTVVSRTEDSLDRIHPAVSLTYEEASELMTELWRAGVRPESVGTTGELQAVKYHLEDMRKLVFKTG